MNEFNLKKYQKFVQSFQDRLSPVDLQETLEYFEFNELELPIAILIEKIFDQKIKLSRREYEEIRDILIELTIFSIYQKGFIAIERQVIDL